MQMFFYKRIIHKWCRDKIKCFKTFEFWIKHNMIKEKMIESSITVSFSILFVEEIAIIQYEISNLNLLKIVGILLMFSNYISFLNYIKVAFIAIRII